MNPGNESDFELARTVVREGERIIAVFRPSMVAHYTQVQNAMCCCLMLPCFWPHAAILSPLWISMCFSAARLQEATLYVLTDRTLYRHLEPTASCCSNVRAGDVEVFAIVDIRSGKQSQQGGSSITCCGDVAVLTLVVPSGHTIANAGGGKHRPANRVEVLMNSDEQGRLIAEKIREAKSQLGGWAGGPVAGQVVGMPPMGQMQVAPMQVVTEVTQVTAVVPQDMERNLPHEAGRLARAGRALERGV